MDLVRCVDESLKLFLGEGLLLDGRGLARDARSHSDHPIDDLGVELFEEFPVSLN